MDGYLIVSIALLDSTDCQQTFRKRDKLVITSGTKRHQKTGMNPVPFFVPISTFI